MKTTSFTLIAVLILFLSGCSPKSHDKLIVGMQLVYPPFEMADEKGRPTGVSVDLAMDLGKYLDREVEIENISFDGLIPALKTGKIDLIISSMTATPERAQSIDFSDPYLKTGLCLLVNKNSPVKSIKDMEQAGRVVAVKKGTTGHIYTVDNIKQGKVLVLDQESACVLEVVQGKADAFIYDQMSTYQNWKRNEDTTRAVLTPFKQESWAVGVRKGNLELLAKVNAFLKDYKTKGGFDGLGDRYLKDQKEAFRKLGYPFYF